MVEQLSQAAHCGTERSLSAVPSEVFVHTGSSGIVDVVGLSNSQRSESASLALQTRILAHESWTRRGRERCDEVDTPCC